MGDEPYGKAARRIGEMCMRDRCELWVQTQLIINNSYMLYGLLKLVTRIPILIAPPPAVPPPQIPPLRRLARVRLA